MKTSADIARKKDMPRNRNGIDISVKAQHQHMGSCLLRLLRGSWSRSSWFASATGFLLTAFTRSLSGLQIGQPSRLIMDIANLLVCLEVEISHFTTSRGIQGLLKVRMEAAPPAGSLVADLITLVQALCFLTGMVLFIETRKSVRESLGETAFLVECNGLLNGLVADGVALGKVLGEDAGTRLVFLLEVFCVLILSFGCRCGFISC